MKRIPKWAVAHPWLVIIACVIVTGLFISFIPQIESEPRFTEYLLQDDPAAKDFKKAWEEYGSPAVSMVIIKSEDTIFKRSTLRKIKELESELSKIDGLENVSGPTNTDFISGTKLTLSISPALPRIPADDDGIREYRQKVMDDPLFRGTLISTDGKAAAILLKLKSSQGGYIKVANHVLAKVKSFQGPEKIYFAGTARINQHLDKVMDRDLMALILLVLLVIAFLLYLSLGTAKGVILPLLVAGISVIWTAGIMGIFGFPLTPFSMTMPVVLVAIGTADGIHILNNYQVKLKGKLSPKKTIIKTMEEMSSPVVITSLTTAVGFLSLLSAFLWPQRDFALLTAIGILIAMFLSLVLIPALLSLFPSAKRPSWTDRQRNVLAKVLIWFGSSVKQHRKSALVVAFFILIVFLVGAREVRVETNVTDLYGKRSRLSEALNVADETFGGSMGMAIDIDTGRKGGLKDPEMLKKMVRLQGFLLEQDHVGYATSFADLVRELNQKFHDDPQYFRIPDSAKTEQLIHLSQMQGSNIFTNMVLPDFSKGLVMARVETIGTIKLRKLVDRTQEYLKDNFGHSANAKLVGISRVYTKIDSMVVKGQITSLISAMLLALLVISLLMGSFVAGLISIIPLFLAVAGNFGIMGYLNIPLGMGTAMVTSVTIGIGVDYSIHFLSRYRRNYLENKDQALAKTMRTTGRGIFYNALTVAGGFLVLMFSSFPAIDRMGILTALTMMLSSLATFSIIPPILEGLKPKFLKRNQ